MCCSTCWRHRQVLIENYRPGTLEQMGLGPDVLHARNPGLIIVRITGFGQDGPYRDRPGFGTLVEAMSGFASKNGFGDRPPVLPPLAMADMVSGLYGAYAVMVALRVVEHGGKRPDHRSAAAGTDGFGAGAGRGDLPRVGRKAAAHRQPLADHVAAQRVCAPKDGRFIAISASMQAMAERVFRAIGKPEMIDDPRFRTNTDRVRNIDECDGAVADVHRRADAGREHGDVRGGRGDRRRRSTRSTSCWTTRTCRSAACIVEAPDEEAGSVLMHNVIPRLSETPGRLRFAAPSLGQHTGRSWARSAATPRRIAALAADGV